MKINQSNNTKKIIFISLVAILILGALSTVAAHYYKVGPFASNVDDSINLSKPSEDELKNGSDTKQQTVDSDENKNQTGSDPAQEPQPIENSDKKSVHAEITAANQDESYLRVRTLIQTVASSGACTLVMTGPQAKAYTATAAVQALPSSSTCKGFDIPLDNLSSGAWTIKIDFNNDELTASTSKEIIIE
ncbi:MAG: hypothetical protein WAZ21_00450 [Candidatus Saccharimonadales bacterium]